jgi:hypothetical protein
MVQTSIPSSSVVRFVKAASPKQFMHTALQKNYYFQCCGSGMFIPDPGSEFFYIPDTGLGSFSIPDPGSASKNLSILTQKNGF